MRWLVELERIPDPFIYFGGAHEGVSRRKNQVISDMFLRGAIFYKEKKMRWYLDSAAQPLHNGHPFGLLSQTMMKCPVPIPKQQRGEILPLSSASVHERHLRHSSQLYFFSQQACVPRSPE